DQPALGEVARALERDEAHRLRLREMPLGVAGLPDAGVRLAPGARDVVGEVGDLCGGVGVERPYLGRVQVGGVEDVAVGVELALRRRLVADPHRSRSAVAGEVELPFAPGAAAEDG